METQLGSNHVLYTVTRAQGTQIGYNNVISDALAIHQSELGSESIVYELFDVVHS